MLITLTCSPAHRLAPNSHWLIVLSTPSTPDLTHRGAESVGHSDVFWHTHFPVDSTERQKSQENKCYMNKGPGCRINLSSTQIRTSVNPISFYSFNKRKHLDRLSQACSPRRKLMPQLATDSHRDWPRLYFGPYTAELQPDKVPLHVSGRIPLWCTTAQMPWASKGVHQNLKYGDQTLM